MRLAVVSGRSKIVEDGRAVDVAKASQGRLGPHPMSVYEKWDAFREWAASASRADGAPFDPDRADAPAPAPRQLFGIGLNYRAHRIESGLPEPDVPLVFAKFASSIAPPVGEIALHTDQVDWEAEVAIVIGRRAHRVEAKDAWEHVAGVTAAQDFSARDVQFRPSATPQFSLGKSLPGFTPLGPLLVTPDELDDPDDIPLSCAVNGRVAQSSSTADLIFGVGELIEYLSWLVPLLPGDVVLTGTPAGVGMGRTPPRYLSAGDEVITRVADLTMRHVAVAPAVFTTTPSTNHARSLP